MARLLSRRTTYTCSLGNNGCHQSGMQVTHSNNHAAPTRSTDGRGDASWWRISICMVTDSNSRGFSHHQNLLLPTQVGDKNLHLTNTFFCIEKVMFHCYSSFGERTLSSALQNGIPYVPYLELRCVWPDNEPRTK